MPRSRHLIPAVLLAWLLAGCARRSAPVVLPGAAVAAPQRIVAASVFSAEVLCAIAPPERLVGVHYLAADPDFSLVAGQAAGLPRVGADPEGLLAVHPDLVVLDAFTNPETAALLTAGGVRTMRCGPAHDLADVVRDIRVLGHACDLDDGAEDLVEHMHRELVRLAPARERVAAFRLLTLDGALHTYGEGSLLDAVIEAAGAVNLAAERGVGPFRKLDLETVLSWRPDALVLAVPSSGGSDPRDWLRQDPGLRLLPCVQRDRLLLVPTALHGTTSHHVTDLAGHVQRQLLAWERP